MFGKGGENLSAKERANTEKVAVFLPPDVLDELRKMASQTGSSVSGMIRAIIFEKLAKK